MMSFTLMQWLMTPGRNQRPCLRADCLAILLMRRSLRPVGGIEIISQESRTWRSVRAGVGTVLGLAANPGLPFGSRSHLDRGWICSGITTSDQINRTLRSDVKPVQQMSPFICCPLAFCLVRLGAPLMRHSTDDTWSLVVQGSRVSQDL